MGTETVNATGQTTETTHPTATVTGALTTTTTLASTVAIRLKDTLRQQPCTTDRG